MPSSADTMRTTEVAILADRFEPHAIEVPLGAEVTWTNHDEGEHTISSAEIESGLIPPGAAFRHTFDRPGRHRYFCMAHPQCVADVFVR